MIILNSKEADSLTKMATWFKRMIVDRNIGTADLTAAYCDELISALKPRPQIHMDILSCRATRDIKKDETITVEVSEYIKLLEKENGRSEENSS